MFSISWIPYRSSAGPRPLFPGCSPFLHRVLAFIARCNPKCCARAISELKRRAPGAGGFLCILLHGNPRVPKVCGARHTRARSRDHKKSETLLGQHSATVGTELCLSCNKWCSIRGWNYGTDSSFYASFLHFQCTSTHQRKRQRSKCVYWYFFTNNIPTIFK